MPTYEYRCPEGHKFEKFQRMSDPPEAACPECGEAAERMMSAGAGLLFKGEGFYITDYRSDSYRKAAEKDKKSGSAGEGKTGETGSQSESKSGPNGESKPKSESNPTSESKSKKKKKGSSE